MKTKWFIIPVIALSLGCTREIETNVTYIDGEFTLYASSGENETKTVLQRDGSVFWSPGDCITVFYGNIPGKFTSTNTEPAASAEFTGSLGSFVVDGETEFKAIYPHSDDIVMPTDEGILSIFLPSEQTAVEGTFADDLFICVAKSKDVNLHFYNVCGGVKFSLARDDIKKVVFKGNNGEILAGRMAVEFDSNGIPQVTDMTGGRTSITLLAPDGGSFKAGSFYYLVLVPQVLSKGYKIELFTDDLVETISSDSSVSVRRSAWGVLKDLAPNESVEFKAVDLGLSVKWANMNLGADNPEDYGDYYAWGETEPYYSSLDPLTWKPGAEYGYDWGSYSWCMGSYNTMTKYCLLPSFGYNYFTDNKNVLEPEDDAAHVILGDKWRMPTKQEQDELWDNCTWEWKPRNGVNGCQVTGPNGVSIFIPAAGMLEDTSFWLDGMYGYLWSSTLDMDDSATACDLFFTSGTSSVFGGANYLYRNLGQSIRAVYDESIILVSSVSLNKTGIDLNIGETSILSATVLPNNATNKKVSWSSSNESVATVSSEGLVTGVAAGSAIITVTTSDGGKTATCNVTVKESSSPSVLPPNAVDLGLPSGIKWASHNLGASKPEENGDYYAWGETEPYYSSLDPLTWKSGKESGYAWSSYKWCMGASNTLTKYCTKTSYGYNGFTDNKTELDPEDDVVIVTLGGKWRMPTDSEWTELREKCTWTWRFTSMNGPNGYEVTGPNGVSIFLPTASYWQETNNYGIGTDGFYWSSTLNKSSTYDAYFLKIASGTIFRGYRGRNNGFTIRPVYDD